MAGGKFIGYVLDLLPGVAKFIKKKARANEIDKIDNAIDTADTEFINSKLRDVEKKYDRESKGNS